MSIFVTSAMTPLGNCLFPEEKINITEGYISLLQKKQYVSFKFMSRPTSTIIILLYFYIFTISLLYIFSFFFFTIFFIHFLCLEIAHIYCTLICTIIFTLTYLMNKHNFILCINISLLQEERCK